MSKIEKRTRYWRRRWADKLERINDRLDATERAEMTWADPLTTEWREQIREEGRPKD